MPNDQGMYTPATDSAVFRSHDEMENLYFAVIDTAMRAKGLGELKSDVDLDKVLGEHKDDVLALVKAVMSVWGITAEDGQLDQRDQLAQDGTVVESGFGAATRRPFVNIEAKGQYRPEGARQVALQILDAAAIAETDAVTVRWAEDTLDLTPDVAVQMMGDLRKFRVSSREADLRMEGDDVPDVQAIRLGTTRAIGQ